MPPPVRLRRLAGAAVLPLILIAGCSGDEEPEASPSSSAPGEQPGEPTGTASSAPTEPTESTEPTDTPEPPEETTSTPSPEPQPQPEPEPEPTDGPTSPPKGLRAALLTPQRLPAPGDLTWTAAQTRKGSGGEDISVCQVTDLEALGTSRAFTRRFTSGSVTATQVVAQFVDEVGSQGGYDILQAWLSRCAKQARAAGFESVKAPKRYTPIAAGDSAGWALVTYGPVPDDPNAAFIEAQALVRVGDTLSWVVWEETGQDYNYAPGQTPPERAVPLLAEALGAP